MTPSADYTTLSWNVLFNRGLPGENEAAMREMECDVAQRIFAWLSTQPDKTLRPRIQALPFQILPSPQRHEALRLEVWLGTNAAQWIGTRNAPSHNALLWQFAFVRLSAFLNTGHWEPIDMEMAAGGDA